MHTTEYQDMDAESVYKGQSLQGHTAHKLVAVQGVFTASSDPYISTFQTIC